MLVLKLRNRPATTLVELLLFTAFFAVSSGALITFFFSTTEQRVRQQSVSAVEQTGVQIMQTLSNRIRSAERIADPAAASSGSILALQLADETYNPTIIGLSGAVLYVGEANTIKRLSPDTVELSNFHVRNTSVDDARASVLMQFTVSQTTKVSTSMTYSRTFEAVVSLFPDDIASTQCGCTAPQCSDGQYQWQYCEEETCVDATVSVPC